MRGPCTTRANNAQSTVVGLEQISLAAARSSARSLRFAGGTPFLKWAGGKRWLAQRYPQLIPTNIERHIEPFLGSGAIFFFVGPKKAILNDANSELVDTYRDVKSRWRLLEDRLKVHAKNHSDEYYYEVRSKSEAERIDRSARFLYLNRSCWNGLYRVNRKGIFNVPKGTKDVIVSDADQFEKNSCALQAAELTSGDFSVAIRRAEAGDFVFVDPPYTVAHNLNGFVKYNDKIFTWDDQVRLREDILAASNRGARILLTNADHKSLRDLYNGLGEHVTLDRATVISGSNSGRKSTTELAVKFGY